MVLSIMLRFFVQHIQMFSYLCTPILTQSDPKKLTCLLNVTQRRLYFVAISFQDTGEGISPDHVGKVFEPLFSTKAKGTGLGLVACENIIRGHNGTVEVSSEEGKGSTFMVKLPIKD